MWPLNKIMAWQREMPQIALLLILLAAFFWKPLWRGDKLLPVDIAYTDPVYLYYAPPGFTKPHNILLYDQAYQFYPWRVYISQALRRGFLPLWNPYIYCGTPLMAEDQPAVLYPLNILSYLFSPSDSFLFTAVARLFVAGLATYWFVRTIGGDKFGALVSAISFAFSGFMIVWLGHPHTNVAAWLPAWFLAVERLYRKNSVQHILPVALVVAFQLTGGHAETALYTLTAGAFYYLFHLATTWWNDRKLKPVAFRLLFFGAACALGFALASVHLLPFWEWLQQSAELHLRAGADNLRAWRLGPKYWFAGILPIFLPNIFNNPTWPGEYKSFFPGLNFQEQTAYIGVIGLSLAVAVSIVRRRDRRILFLATLGVVTLGAALRLPIFDWVNYLPLFSLASFGRFRLIYTFCASILAGFGAQGVLDSRKGGSVLRLAICFLAGFVALAIPAFLIVYRALNNMAAQLAVTWIRQWSLDILRQGFRVSNIKMYWSALVALAGALVLVLYLRSKLTPRMVQISLLLLVILDLFAFGLDYHTTIQEEFIFPETPALRLIKEDKSIFRIVGTNIDLMPNTCMVHGFYDVRGLDFPIRRYWELCKATGGQDWLGYGILFTEQLEPRLLSLLNVKYVLTSSDLRPEIKQDMVLLSVDKNIKVYQNLSCLPRAFIVHQVRVMENSKEALKLLHDPDFQLGREIVLTKAPPPEFIETQHSMLQTTAEIMRYEPNHVTIQASTPVNGFLFLSDSYYPGWKAYVDDVETEIYLADYAFRAVYLTPGQHRVEFIYEPGSFRIASIVSLLALFGSIALSLCLWKVNGLKGNLGRQ